MTIFDKDIADPSSLFESRRPLVTSELENRTDQAAQKFSMQVLKQIYKSEYEIPISQGVFKKVVVTQTHIEQSLGMLTLKSGNNTLIDDIRSHIERLGKLLPFCSSPKSFSSSWNLRSQILTKDAANRLVNEGAQLLPC
jgi:hypothetical protein